jgi:acyl transferase domain-containing protein
VRFRSVSAHFSIPTGLRNDDGAQRMLTAANEAIIAGAAFNRQAWFPRMGRFARLPNYPWQRERHWHPVTAESLGLIYRQEVHPLLGYPLAQHTLTWENLLDVELNPLLADHVVGEAIVFPAAGFAELALAAAFVWQPDEVAVIENLEIRQPLLLGDERSMVVRTTIDARDGSLAITSREQLSHDPWVLHAVARIVPEPRDNALRQLAPPCPGRPPDFDANGHAALTSAAGIRYGQAFRCLAHGWIDSGEALGILSPPPQVQNPSMTGHLHHCVGSGVDWAGSSLTEHVFAAAARRAATSSTASASAVRDVFRPSEGSA